MKKQLLVLGCAALAAIGAACSSDPAFKTAVISPMEEPSEQVRQKFANELRTLESLEMKQEVLKNCNGELRYCQGVYNADEPGKFAILVFLHGFGERGEELARRTAILVAQNGVGKGKSVYFKTSTGWDVDGTKLLGLFGDIIELLPDEIASLVTFSTFSACVPSGTVCHLRGIYDKDRHVIWNVCWVRPILFGLLTTERSVLRGAEMRLELSLQQYCLLERLHREIMGLPAVGIRFAYKVTDTDIIQQSDLYVFQYGKRYYAVQIIGRRENFAEDQQLMEELLGSMTVLSSARYGGKKRISRRKWNRSVFRRMRPAHPNRCGRELPLLRNSS